MEFHSIDNNKMAFHCDIRDLTPAWIGIGMLSEKTRMLDKIIRRLVAVVAIEPSLSWTWSYQIFWQIFTLVLDIMVGYASSTVT